MKSMFALLSLLVISAPTKVTFDKANGWKPVSGKWQIEKVGEQSVYTQTSKSPSSVFNVALLHESSAKDVKISVRLKAKSGKIDQGGGLVWRAKDGRNYYIARYNPLEDNLRLYFVKKGRRQQLKSADLEIDHAAWHQLEVEMKADRVTVSLDAKKYLETQDKTFTGAGKVGLWTKADAVTHFDDLQVTPQ